MKIRYDRSVNAAYIYLVSQIEPGQVKNQYHCDIKKVRGMINLDFDSEGRLLGIEVLDADHFLSKELLDQAEIIG
jgi:Protein of unknown function (DUF2283).